MPVTSSTTLMLTLVANQLLWQPFTYTGHYSYSVTTLQGCLTCAPIYGITGTGSVTSNNIGSSIVVMPCVPSLLGRVGIVRSVTGIVLGRSLTRYMLPITYIISISSMVLLNVAIMHLVIDIINVIVIVLPMSCILRLSFLASML